MQRDPRQRFMALEVVAGLGNVVDLLFTLAHQNRSCASAPFDFTQDHIACLLHQIGQPRYQRDCSQRPIIEVCLNFRIQNKFEYGLRWISLLGSYYQG